MMLFQFVLAVLRDVSLIDLLDVAIVGWGIHKVLLLIEGTRAFNLLKGLGFILLLLMFTKDLDFNTLNWVLSNTLPTGFLALVVIFQPELRRALEEIGRARSWASRVPTPKTFPNSSRNSRKPSRAARKSASAP